ncbi:MAG: AraC family transcriptional regulator [Planctomycetota bacterium]|nr:AraC family transcriptional regulator [Planctomycetota bacterium]
MAKMTKVPEQPIRGSVPLLQPSAGGDIQSAGAGHIPAKRDWIHHCFTIWAIGLVVSGRGSYRVEDGSGADVVRRIEPGCAFAVFPGPRFHYGPDPGTTWEEYFVCLTGPGTRRLLKAGWLFDDGSVRPVSKIGELVEAWRGLIAVLKRGQPGDLDRAGLATQSLLLELHHARADVAQARAGNPAIEAVLDHCRLHFAQPIDLPALARRHAMSYSLLRQRVRQITGLPPARYIAHLRCDAARRLLGETDLPVKQVASSVGVADPFTFSRTFRRCTGLSPLQYREQAQPWAGAR